jgi:hypothetical protein
MPAGLSRSLRVFPANGNSRLSANERNPRSGRTFPRAQARLGTAPKGQRQVALPRNSSRARVITKHPVTAGHIP